MAVMVAQFVGLSDLPAVERGPGRVWACAGPFRACPGLPVAGGRLAELLWDGRLRPTAGKGMFLPRRALRSSSISCWSILSTMSDSRPPRDRDSDLAAQPSL